MAETPPKRPPVVRLAVASVILVGGGLFFLSRATGLNFQKWLLILSRFSPWLIAIAAMGVSLQVALQISRWFSLFPAKEPVRWVRVARAFLTGQAVNTFVPARAGDVVKILALKGKNTGSQDVARTTGVVIADKLIDLLSLLLAVALFASWLLWEGLPSWRLPTRSEGIVAGLIIVTVFAAVALIRGKRGFWIRQKFIQLGSGLVALRNPPQLLRGTALGMAAWMAEASVLKLICSGQSVSCSLAQAICALLVLNLGVAIPVSFANIGTYEASMGFALTRFGVPLEEALAIATVHHALQILIPLCLIAPVWIFQKTGAWARTGARLTPTRTTLWKKA